MRSVSATLVTAQSAASRTPYIDLVFTNKAGTTTYDYSARLLALEHHEAAYDDYATVILRNDDLAVVDITGYWVDIGYGDVTGGGNEHAHTARLWVKQQHEVSAAGKLQVILKLEGTWRYLTEQLALIGNPPLYQDESEALAAKTVYGIIEYIVETMLGWSLDALGTQDDGIINSFEPAFEVNNYPYETYADLLKALIRMTKCYIRAKTDKVLEIRYPQEDDSTDITFYSAQQPYFFEYAEVTNIMIPNDVLVFANAGEDELWTEYISAEAKDQAAIDKYDTVKAIELAPTITEQTDTNNRAAAILTRALAEQLAGKLIIPHDCRIELYDRVAIVDSRGT